MDPVSLTLAVLPLCSSVLLGLSKLRDNFKFIRNHDRNISNFRSRLETHGGNFEAEMELMLREVVEAKTAWSMMGDHAEARWSAPDVGSLFREYLGPRYDHFREAVMEVDTVVKQLRIKLATFSSPDEPTPWLDRFKLSVKRKEYEEHFGTLKEAVAKIRRLRKHRTELRGYEERQRRPPEASHGHARDVQDFIAVRAAAKHLYAALHEVPLCDRDDHLYHCVKLLLHYGKSQQGEKGRETKLALLLEYAAGNGSMSLGWRLPIQASYTETLDDGVTREYRPGNSSIVPCDNLCRQLRAVYGNDNAPPPPRPPSPPIQPEFLGIFSIETLPDHMHSFNTLSHQDTALIDLLNRPVPVHYVLSDVDRLKLALALVEATLRHWDTPWWPMGCLLSDIRLIGRPTDSVGPRLESLHVAAAMGEEQDPSSHRHGPTENEMEDARVNYGIWNLVLYRLGVALLQIGLWDAVPWHDHRLVRRRMDRLSFCGKTYWQVTERFVACNFGETTNLDDDGLQRAICRKAIVDLEKLIKMAQAVPN